MSTLAEDYKKPVSVLVLIHTPQLDVLLLERASHPGFWQSVTGSQDDDEDLRRTAQWEKAREALAEETKKEAQKNQKRSFKDLVKK